MRLTTTRHDGIVRYQIEAGPQPFLLVVFEAEAPPRALVPPPPELARLWLTLPENWRTWLLASDAFTADERAELRRLDDDDD